FPPRLQASVAGHSSRRRVTENAVLIPSPISIGKARHRVHARVQRCDCLPRRILPEYRPFGFPQSHALDRLRQWLLSIVQLRCATAAVLYHCYLPTLAKPLIPEAARVARASDVLISLLHRDRSELAPA